MQTFTDIFNLKQLESSQFWCSYNCDKELLPTQRERALVVLFNQDGIISVHCCNLDRMKSLRSIGPGLVSWIVFGFTRNKERLALRLQTRFVSIWPDKPKEPKMTQHHLDMSWTVPFYCQCKRSLSAKVPLLSQYTETCSISVFPRCL